MFSIRLKASSVFRSAAKTQSLPRAYRTFTSTPAIMSAIQDAVVKEHRELEQYYNEVVTSNDHDHQQRFGNQFIWELARHSVGEELVVYPAFAKYMGDEGKAMADSDRQEHHQVKELLKQFQSMEAKQPEFMSKIRQIWDLLSKHIKEEEERDMPALTAALQGHSEESEKLARSFGRTKAFVPSRSHPSAGENPPFETVMGLLTAPFDHIADVFRKFPDKTVSPNPSTK